ncbi:unnamed protein product [Pseudo-nitzschia multistriata]|uniref:Uncharacterized protein n=1 Tax=Pseudo-nitzschia multistriata TaxID=183589 RepID=A0A448Z4H3_9STRA|nr:unnamed protein product [Pseudo-nitzschia multistriata]
MSSAKKITLSISLSAAIIEWLDASAKSQSLPSQSKVIRCCINCVALGDVKMTTDGNVSPSVCPSEYRTLNIEVAPQQIDWIDSVVSKIEGSSQSEIIQSVLTSCMNADKDVVFGVVRCKSKVTACEGAQAVIDSLSKQYGKDNVEIKEEISLL